jgi:hypothetical protein
MFARIGMPLIGVDQQPLLKIGNGLGCGLCLGGLELRSDPFTPLFSQIENACLSISTKTRSYNLRCAAFILDSLI